MSIAYTPFLDPALYKYIIANGESLYPHLRCKFMRYVEQPCVQREEWCLSNKATPRCSIAANAFSPTTWLDQPPDSDCMQEQPPPKVRKYTTTRHQLQLHTNIGAKRAKSITLAPCLVFCRLHLLILLFAAIHRVMPHHIVSHVCFVKTQTQGDQSWAKMEHGWLFELPAQIDSSMTKMQRSAQHWLGVAVDSRAQTAAGGWAPLSTICLCGRLQQQPTCLRVWSIMCLQCFPVIESTRLPSNMCVQPLIILMPTQPKSWDLLESWGGLHGLHLQANLNSEVVIVECHFQLWYHLLNVRHDKMHDDACVPRPMNKSWVSVVGSLLWSCLHLAGQLLQLLVAPQLPVELCCKATSS